MLYTVYYIVIYIYIYMYIYYIKKYREKCNKNSSVKISSIYEDKQEHNKNTKRKSTKFRKGIRKMANDIKKMKRWLWTKIKTDEKQLKTQETAKKKKRKKQKRKEVKMKCRKRIELSKTGQVLWILLNNQK